MGSFLSLDLVLCKGLVRPLHTAHAHRRSRPLALVDPDLEALVDYPEDMLAAHVQELPQRRLAEVVQPMFF